MKKIASALLVAAIACGCLVSCNDKPKHYRFVKVMTDGKEEIENIDAKNDTDALQQYFSRMEKVIIANLDKQETPVESMFVISPDGDTLNTNEQLLEAVAKTLPTMAAPATAPAPAAEPAEPKPAN